jgi:hypothetical protein
MFEPLEVVDRRRAVRGLMAMNEEDVLQDDYEAVVPETQVYLRTQALLHIPDRGKDFHLLLEYFGCFDCYHPWCWLTCFESLFQSTLYAFHQCNNNAK